MTVHATCDRCGCVMVLTDREYRAAPWNTICDYCSDEMEQEYERDRMEMELSHERA